MSIEQLLCMPCFNTGNTAGNQPDRKESLPSRNSHCREFKPKIRYRYKETVQTIRISKAVSTKY